MTDRPKLDANEVKSVRRWAKRESPSGSWDVRLDRVFDMVLLTLATTEQEKWACANTECDELGEFVIAVGATRIFCPKCGSDMVKQDE